MEELGKTRVTYQPTLLQGKKTHHMMETEIFGQLERIVKISRKPW
jgi:hypothetical protein